MDPITCLIGLAVANIIVEKGLLPVKRLYRGRVGIATDCGALGVLGLTLEELRELLQHPIVRRGRDTQAVYARAAGR